MVYGNSRFGAGRAAACALAVLILWAGAAGGAGGQMIFSFEVVHTRELSGLFSVAAGDEISVHWGDGTVETFSGVRQEYSKDYGEPVSLEVKIYAPHESSLLRFQMHQRGAIIRFDLKDLPAGLEHLSVEGSNTVTGGIADLPEGLKSLNVRGSSTLKGDVSELPEGLARLYVYGHNMITGDIADLPKGLARFYLYGKNTVRGDIGKLPRGLHYFRCNGENALMGDIAKLPAGLIIFDARGSNTVAGDIAKLPERMTHFFVYGGNTVTGDIAKLPAGLSSMHAMGRNTIRGDISGLPDGMTSLIINGLNTVTGDIAKLPAGMTILGITGSSRFSGYTPGRDWADGLNQISLVPADGFGLTTEEVDSLLADLARVKWTRHRRLIISGGNAPRSAASDGAVATLEEMGVRLTLN